MTKIESTPIAMLHHVSDRSDWGDLKPFAIRRDKFMQFLDTVEANGRRTTTFEALSLAKKNVEASIIITFDDCGKHLLNFAVPELTRRQMKAVFFMPTAHLRKYNYWDIAEGRSAVDLMDASDLRELQRSGMEVGDHRHVHLGRLDPEALRPELATCQSTLTEILGHPAKAFAYPFGSIPAQASNAISEHGFEFACAIFSPGQATHQLRRFIVHDGDSARTMRLKMNPLYRWYRALTDSRKNAASWT